MEKYVKPTTDIAAIEIGGLMQGSDAPQADDAIFGWDDYYDKHQNVIQQKSVWEK